MTFSEKTLLFGADRNLVGTLTTPATTTAKYAVLLTNVGVMPRCGPYRSNVIVARRFASIGVPSFRYDMSGLGDSARASNPLPHAQQWVLDTKGAMDVVEKELGIKEFIIVGVCAGADVAYLTAPEDVRVRAAVMFDPYLYPTTKAKLIGLQKRLHAHGVINAASAAADAVVRRIVARLPKKAAPAGENVEPPLKYGRSYIPPLDTFAERMKRIVDGGAKILILVSGSFPYDHNYREQTADNLRPYGIADKIEYDYLPEADHVLLGVPGREQFIEKSIAFAQRVFARS
jgi:hypothetical protein